MLKELLAGIGLSDLAQLITALGVIFMATKKGRELLIKPAMDGIKKLTLGQKRQELLFLIHSDPHNVEAIEHVYDEYHKLGGNSYVDKIMRDWREKYECPEEGPQNESI